MNPREHVKATTFRSGEQLQVKEKKNEGKVGEKNEEQRKDDEPSPLVKEYRPIIPYLTKLKKDHMDE